MVLGSLGFENAYAFAMRAPTAPRRWASRSLADLAREAPRPDPRLATWSSSRGRSGRRSTPAYGLRFKTKRSIQPTFMYRALAGGEADVIAAFSSDGRIAATSWWC